MKAGTLDSVTDLTFQWERNRTTASEREAEMRQLVGAEDPAPETVSADIVARDKLADKGRVRRIKVKVYRVLALP